MTRGKQKQQCALVSVSQKNYQLLSGLADATGVTCKEIVDQAVEELVARLFSNLRVEKA